MSCVIDRLLKERQTTALRDRRAADRQPFVRPVMVEVPRQPSAAPAFSRDVSQHGISLVMAAPIAPGTIASLRIHSLFGQDAKLKAEVRWCEEYGEGWYVSGWVFLDV